MPEPSAHTLASLGIARWRLRAGVPGLAAGSGSEISGPGSEAGALVPSESRRDAPSGLLTDLDALREQVSACTACPLAAGRHRTVFGEGNPHARWMFIGEAPGRDEDMRGEPFVGKAGRLLSAMLAALSVTREQVYIANVVKCRPPQNRDPAPEERAACDPFLRAQIAAVAPELIIVLGRVAAQSLLGTDQQIGKLRGRLHALPGTSLPLVVTYHPAYLLRNPAHKGRVWQDLLMARRTTPPV